jgi:hypothetical protein
LPPAAGGWADTSYETSPEWNSEPQNNEYRTAEFRRVISLRSVFFIKKIEYLPSTFDIHYSIFIIRFFLKFLIPSDRPLFWPAAALPALRSLEGEAGTPETLSFLKNSPDELGGAAGGVPPA